MTERVGVMEALVEEPATVEETPAPEPKPVDDNAELWPGGPNKIQIETWKQAYGDVYLTEVGDEKYIVWRTLNRKEYRDLVAKLEQSVASGKVTQAEANLDNEEEIASICILFPKLTMRDREGDMAGIPSLIAQQVMEASGFISQQVRIL